jgi:8-oxo-dGTP pyrophosphatase MutT (NUDIX family)
LRQFTDGYNKEAAVLMPIFERDGEPHFLLTRRTDEVETHKGQISFPGGGRRENESLEAAALRETREEVGINEQEIEILGRFHDYLSSTGYRVSPFAAFLGQPFEVTLNAREVAEVLLVPFQTFLDPAGLRVERMDRQGRMVDVYFYSYGKYEIWGLTARIIRDFLEEIRGSR